MLLFGKASKYRILLYMETTTFNILTFPIWWYSEGLQLAFRHARSRWGTVLRSTGLIIFLRNMTQPLYGDYTRSGRAISFFLRVFLLVFILIWTVVRLIIVLAGLLLHIVAFPVIVIMIIYQLFPI